MTQEEKAKRFDEALAMAKECITYVPDDAVNKYMLNMFPELKESEDEEIRKDIINYISTADDKELIPHESWIAWLEKQKVLTAEEDLQGKEDVLWCIKQAEKHAKDENEMGTCWFAKKWLEKQGSQNLANSTKTCKDEYVRLKECAIKEKQSAWSVHDEDMLNDIEESLEAFSNKLRYEKDFMLADTVKKEMEWVKSLKDRVQPQPEWSEEDEQYLLVCKNALAKYQVTDKWDSNIISQWLDNKLKSLKPQKQWKPSYEQMVWLYLAVLTMLNHY